MLLPITQTLHNYRRSTSGLLPTYYTVQDAMAADAADAPQHHIAAVRASPH